MVIHAGLVDKERFDYLLSGGINKYVPKKLFM